LHECSHPLMTGWGEKIAGVSEEELKNHVEVTKETKPIWRIVAAIEYKDGLSPSEFEEKYGISDSSVYTWLNRFEERGVEDALHDDPKPGADPELSDEQWNQFVDDLHTSPDELGYDYQAWFPVLAHHHLKSKFGVEYCLRHVKRLLKKADLSWRTARPRHYEADPEEEREFQETVQKNETN
jgi:transposase